MSKMKISAVEEVSYGVYVWEMPDGRYVGDDEQHYLSIASMKGNVERISRLAEVVRSYGVNEGKPKFLSGYRKVTDAEYDEQEERMRNGLIPDSMDLPAIIEEAKAIRESGGY